MKRLSLLLLTILPSLLFAQGTWNQQSVNNKVNRVKVDSVLIVPRDTSSTNNALYLGGPVGDSGRIAYSGGIFWGKNGTVWVPFVSGSGGLISLNGLTTSVQTFATGTAGTNFNIASSGSTHTFNIPDASTSNRGLINTGTQNINGAKTFISNAQFNAQVSINAGPLLTFGSTFSRFYKFINQANSSEPFASPFFRYNELTGQFIWGNTNRPSASLDTIGSFHFLGSLNPDGIPGNIGQQLISRGANIPPVWQDRNDSSFQKNTILLSQTKYIYLFGDSFTTGYGLADPNDRYSLRLGNTFNLLINNQAVDGSGWHTTLYNLYNTYPAKPDSVLFTFLTGFNNLRHFYNPTQMAFNKMEGCLRAALTTIYSDLKEGAWTGANTVRTGTWVISPESVATPTGFPSFSRQALSSNATRGTVAGSKIVYTTPSATRSLAAVYYQVSDTAYSANIRIKVDGKTYDSLNTFRIDTFTSGGPGWSKVYAPTAFYVTSLPLAVHTLEIEIISSISTGGVEVDWMGSLNEKNKQGPGQLNNAPVIVGLIPDLPRSQQVLDTADINKMRTASNRYIEVVRSFAGYPVRIADPNRYFRPDSGQVWSFDMVHPNSWGNAMLFRAFVDPIFKEDNVTPWTSIYDVSRSIRSNTEIGLNGYNWSFMGSGNIGYGTRSPLYSIHAIGTVAGGIAYESTTTLSSTSGGFFRSYAVGTPSASGQRLGGLLLGSHTTGTTYRTGALIEAYSSGTWTDGTSHPTDITISTVPSGAIASSEVLRVTQNKRIGINQPAPAFTLDVTGNARFTQAVTVDTVLTNSSSKTLSLIGGAVGGSSFRGAEINLISGNAAVDPGTLKIFTGTGNSGSQQPEVIRVAASGNVGINSTATPSKLTVAGSVSFAVNAISTNTTLAEHNIVRITTGGIIITLPTAANVTGRFYSIRNETVTPCTITSVSIDGVGTTVFPGVTMWQIYSDGAAWRLLSRSN
jgi:hypothetical protein